MKLIKGRLFNPGSDYYLIWSNRGNPLILRIMVQTKNARHESHISIPKSAPFNKKPIFAAWV